MRDHLSPQSPYRGKQSFGEGKRMGRYQCGPTMRVRSNWEWRYREQGKLRQESFRVADYPTENALWMA